MITFKELLGPNVITDVSIANQHKMEDLLIKINLVRTAWGRPMVVTSGFRSIFQHNRIYSEINARRLAEGKPELPVPTLSKHLSGQAVDILDRDGELDKWCHANEALLAEIGLWCEEKDEQPRVHFQTVPPRSGKRFFKP